MKNKFITGILIILTVIGAACVPIDDPTKTSAETKKTPEKSDPPGFESSANQPKKLTIVNDVTGSTSGGQLERPTGYLKSALTDAKNIVSVDIYSVGVDGKQTREAINRHFDLDKMPENEFNEAQAVKEAKEKGCGNRLACIEREVKIKRNEADSEYQRKLALYNQARDELITEIGNVILQSPTKTPKCTDIQP